MDETEWQELQASWIAKGWAIEVTESDAVGNLKSEIEQLCSKTACDQDTSKTLAYVARTLAKMQDTGKRALKAEKK